MSVEEKNRSVRPKPKSAFEIWRQRVVTDARNWWFRTYHNLAEFFWNLNLLRKNLIQRRGGPLLGFLHTLIFTPFWTVQYVRMWFLAHWPKGRWVNLVLGLPALSVAMGFLIALGIVHWQPPKDMASAYQELGVSALGASDFETAKMCFVRLRELGDKHRSVRYHLALAFQGMESAKASDKPKGSKDRNVFDVMDSDRALTMMSLLAKPYSHGYEPAHLWLARVTLERFPAGTPGRREAVVGHLKHVLATQPDNSEAHALVGMLLREEGKFDEAKEHFEKGLKARPELAIYLAYARYRENDLEGARAEAKKAFAYFSSRIKENPKDVRSRVHCMDARLFQGDHAGAIEIGEEGMKLGPNDPIIARAMATVYDGWANSLPKDDPQRLELWRKSLAVHPWGRDAIRSLAYASRATDAPTVATQAKALLEQLEAEHDAPAMLHFVLWDVAYASNDFTEATRQLEIAHKKEPRSVIVTNNLAWQLAHEEPKDLPRALKLIDEAIKVVPNNPDLRDTRGRVYFFMNRPKDAIEDLRFALRGRLNDVSLHETLAETYRQVGDGERAKMHEQLAKEVAKKQEPSKIAKKGYDSTPSIPEDPNPTPPGGDVGGESNDADAPASVCEGNGPKSPIFGRPE